MSNKLIILMLYFEQIHHNIHLLKFHNKDN